jgi:hypothetical protein
LELVLDRNADERSIVAQFVAWIQKSPAQPYKPRG